MKAPAMKWPAILLASALASCGGGSDSGQDGSALAAELAAGQGPDAADPALLAALHDPIMVDPLLAAKSNADAVRPATQPLSGLIPRDDIATGSSYTTETLRKAPDAVAAEAGCRECAASAQALTLAALAANQPGKDAAKCAATLQYSAAWAQRLPAAAPLFVDARVTEAVGSDAAGCATRAVSFTAATPIATLIDWYYTRATRAGYAAAHWIDRGQHVLTARRGRDGAAVVIYLNERDQGTAIDLVTTGGV